MSTIKSSSEHLTLNADGAGKDISLQANGATKLTVKSDGKVGIGTSSPSSYEAEASDLVIGNNSSSTGLTIASDNTTGNIYFSNSTTGNGKYRGSISYSHANERLNFGTNVGSGNFYMDQDGLKFNGDTATANALDDYEEGIHNVVITSGTNTSTYTLNSSYNKLAYTKIGRYVHVTGVLVCSAVSGTPSGTVCLTLPFAAGNESQLSADAGGAGVGYYQVQVYSSGEYPQSRIGEGTSKIQLLWGVAGSNQYDTKLNTSSQLYVNISYMAA